MPDATMPPELCGHRIFWADYGDRIEAYDRPAARDDAVRLAHAYRLRPAAEHPRVLWSIHTEEPNRWPSPADTKKDAKAALERLARRVLRQREIGSESEED